MPRTRDQRITNRKKPESQIARNHAPTPDFLANSITSKRRFTRLPQALQNSSRATRNAAVFSAQRKSRGEWIRFLDRACFSKVFAKLNLLHRAGGHQ
jgi:hypothetical protein